MRTVFTVLASAILFAIPAPARPMEVEASASVGLLRYGDSLPDAPHDGRMIRVYGPWLSPCGEIVFWGVWDLATARLQVPANGVPGWVSEKGLLVADLTDWSAVDEPRCSPVS